MSTIILALVLGASPPVNAYRLEIDRVYDGDTITATVVLDFGVALPHQPIRAQGYDAWEITKTRRTVKVDNVEIAKGRAAKEALTALLAKHPGRVYLQPVGNGRGIYNRLSGYIVIYPKEGEPISVADFMRSEGHDRATAEAAEATKTEKLRNRAGLGDAQTPLDRRRIGDD